MLWIVREQPVLKTLTHHRGRDGEMKRGNAARGYGLGIELCLDGRSVSNQTQMRARGEQTKIPRLLRGRWTMNEFSGITLNDPIRVADTKLMLIDEEPIAGRIAFEKGDRAFDSPNAADQRAGEKCDDAQMCNEKCNVMFFPRPTRES